MSKQHFALQQERWRIIALQQEGEPAPLFCFVKFARVKQVRGQSRVHPCGGFGILRTGGINSQLHRFDRSLEIAFEPAHVRRAGVCVKVGLQIHHPLISLDRVVQLSLLHQRIAQKPVVEAESSLLDETPRHRFRFLKAMQILQHVRIQQHRFLTLRIAFFNASRALLGQFVKTRVETFARFGNKRPAKLFKPRLKIPPAANLLLEPGNFFVGAAVARPCC